jgi:hypothetical protein
MKLNDYLVALIELRQEADNQIYLLKNTLHKDIDTEKLENGMSDKMHDVLECMGFEKL